MKQAKNITALPTFDPTEGVRSLISQEDRVVILTNQSHKTGLLLTAGKKKLLSHTFNLQKQICEKSALFDVTYGSNLEEQFKNLTPDSQNNDLL